MRLTAGRTPPGDGVEKYHLPVGGSVVIHGGSVQALIKNVFEYRLRNNIPIGNVEADIDAYYCAKWPGFCAEAQTGLGKSAKQQASEMLGRVSQWASTVAQKMPRGGYELTLQSEADQRAATCAQCRFNGGWRSGCGGCDAVTLQLLQSVKKMRTTPRDGNLSACQIGGWENSTAIHLPTSTTAITDEQRQQMPVECWRKKL